MVAGALDPAACQTDGLLVTLQVQLRTVERTFTRRLHVASLAVNNSNIVSKRKK